MSRPILVKYVPAGELKVGDFIEHVRGSVSFVGPITNIQHGSFMQLETVTLSVGNVYPTEVTFLDHRLVKVVAEA